MEREADGSPWWMLAIVLSVEETAQGSRVVVVDHDTPLMLERNNPAYEVIRGILLRSSSSGPSLFGLYVDCSGNILEVGLVDCTCVTGVSENEHNPMVINVRLVTKAGASRLSRDHPRFESLYKVALDALAQQRPVWTVHWTNSLKELKLLNSEQHEAFCQWIERHAGRGRSPR